MNCPQCGGALGREDARCAGCGMELAAVGAGSSASAASGAPAWVWVAAGCGLLLVLGVAGATVAVMIFGSRTSGMIGASSSVLPGSTTVTSSHVEPLDEGATALERALTDYALDHGAPPAWLGELVGLRRSTGTLYLTTSEVPRDAYGRSYVYETSELDREWSARLISLGRDGQLGGSGPDADREVLALRGPRR